MFFEKISNAIRIYISYCVLTLTNVVLSAMFKNNVVVVLIDVLIINSLKFSRDVKTFEEN